VPPSQNALLAALYPMGCGSGRWPSPARTEKYVHSDSLDFFRWWAEEEPGPIHLLYLDSLDYHDHAAREAHHSAEAEAALPFLAARCLALIDDTSPSGEVDGAPTFGGDGLRAIPFLLERGFRIVWAEAGQVLLERDVAAG